ncbi:MAG: valine--tRNA ligase, partial [Oscillospiraceae bacterium]|nr:valine--tRNA ligase [Oscillospiraceae bacterium]
MQKEMPKTYQPQQFEAEMYRHWEESGYFIAPRNPGKRPFTIMMPPPNITGQLHMGHAMDGTIQDVLTRYHRMKGDPALWLPGCDHASIATEVKIIEAMAKEGLTKEGIGREEFLKRAWQWKAEYGGRIVQQFKRLGSSCDWSRERFTMDDGLSRAVNEVFVRLYEKGLIYRGDRIINWCPDCKTTLSDVEVEFEEQHSHLWHIRYPGEDGSEGVVVATTRPETMLGDTGVAVHPEDERYAALRGKNVILPLLNRPIPVVFDEYVDREFGTGAVKMTPAHDPNDFEVAQRHNLSVLRVMNDDGSMNEAAGEYAGLSALEARKRIVAALEAAGHLVKVEPYTHNVGTCYRCHHTVEPLVSRQWFVKMKPLAEPAIAAVREGRTRFVPQRFEKTYFNWMENIRDWCISRQLWWGHRIPAYYCDCGEMIVSRETPACCPHCGGTLRQDEDVLDTWFSSALWPFSTLGWPDDTEDLRYFYPTSVMATGSDLIFFWVARMIFSSIEQMGETPFHTVMIHGMVRDAQGRKMSKSLGNGIDPQESIDQYGADALRFSLVFGVAPGNDMNYSTEKVEAARNFANKVYNAARFVLMNLGDAPESMEGAKLELADQWMLSRLNACIRDMTAQMDVCELSLPAQRIYDFAWSEFCDWYIEWAKPRLLGGTPEQQKAVRAVLLYGLKGLLRLLHPFMPFLTESIWQQLPGIEGTIMLADWPIADPALDFPAEAAACEGVLDAIRAVRGVRAEMKVEPARRLRLLMLPTEAAWAKPLLDSEGAFQRLCGASAVEIIESANEVQGKTVSVVCPAAEILIPLGDLVDAEKEIARLEKEKAAT